MPLIEPRITFLDRSHDRSFFDCGNPALNRYLAQIARQDESRNFSRCYVLIDHASANPLKVLGFYGICASSAKLVALPRYQIRGTAPYPEYPAVLITRLATDLTIQGEGYGEALLMHAVRIAYDIHKLIGIKLIMVHAKDGAPGFYEKYGFLRFADDPNHLFMPIETVIKLVGV